MKPQHQCAATDPARPNMRCILAPGHLGRHLWFQKTVEVKAASGELNGWPEAAIIEIAHRDNIEYAEQRRCIPALAKVACDMLIDALNTLGEMVPVAFTVGGYDSDSRPLWRIPPARKFLVAFGDQLFDVNRSVPIGRILKDSVDLLYACQAIQMGGDVIETEDDDIAESMMRHINEYHDRHTKQ